jgi:hypothetical protein
VTFEHTSITRLALDLGMLSSPLVVEAVTKAVEHSAAGVKKAWNGKLYRDGHADRTGRSITFDVGVARQFSLFQTDAFSGPDEAAIVAEIGPKRGSGKQAGIVRLLENGSVHNAPHGYGAAALQENEADYEARIGFAIWAAEKAAGL